MLLLLEFIVLALIQGVGEILPISSSAHLIIASNIFKINQNDMSLEIILHLASLIALFFYYFDFIKNMINGVFCYIIKKDKSYYKEWNYFTTLIIATIPVCLIGLLLNDYLNNLTSYIGIMLIMNGIILLVSKWKNCYKEMEDLTIIDKLKIGICQCFGLIPGISRSGSSFLGCKLVKLNKEDGFNLTFLLLFPLVIGSFILNIKDFSLNDNLLIPYIIAFLITIMTTYLSVFSLHKCISKGKEKIFGWYCVLIGAIYSIILLVI